MADTFSKAERSKIMAKVHSTGNRSTEAQVEAALREAGIVGWEKHPAIPGKPDFYFPDLRLMIFVDGCYWHSCPLHLRLPQSQAQYWRDKIDGNRRRDNRVRRQLRQQGYHVMRIWEHDLKQTTWLKRLRVMINRLQRRH